MTKITAKASTTEDTQRMRETHIGRGQRSSSLEQRAERLRSCAVTTREILEILSESVLSDSVLESVVLHAEKRKEKKEQEGRVDLGSK